MRFAFGLIAIGCLYLAGCGSADVSTTSTTGSPTGTGSANGGTSSANGSVATSTNGNPVASGTGSTATGTSTAPAAVKPAPIESGIVTLSPENTNIEFVGTHAPPKKPDPRTGGFKMFTGRAEVDADANTLKSVSVDIETGSLWTEFDKLTAHLNSEDFFDTRQHPTAKFESTQISAGEGGQSTITGNLTLMGNSKEISFPANIVVSGEGLTLKAEFKIDRTEFGMDNPKTKGVENPVTLTIAIGEKTQPKKSAGG